MDRVKRIWYLSPMRAAKVQASLRIRAVSPEPPLLAHTSSKSRGAFRQKARSLAPLNGWACAVKICHDGMLEDTNSLDGTQIVLFLRVNQISSTRHFLIWAPTIEFVSSSIPSLQILTAHAQPFRGARDLAFCLKVPLDSLLYERAAKVLARLRGCAGSPEPSLLAYAISTKFAWRGPIMIVVDFFQRSKTVSTRVSYPMSFWSNLSIAQSVIDIFYLIVK